MRGDRVAGMPGYWTWTPWVARLGPEAARTYKLLSQGMNSLNGFTSLYHLILTFSVGVMHKNLATTVVDQHMAPGPNVNLEAN